MSYPLFPTPNNNNKYLNISSTDLCTFFDAYGKLLKRKKMKDFKERKTEDKTELVKALPYSTEVLSLAIDRRATHIGSFCPNCNARLQGLKCKLLCPTPG